MCPEKTLSLEEAILSRETLAPVLSLKRRFMVGLLVDGENVVSLVVKVSL